MSEAVDRGKSETPPKVSIGMPVFNGEPFIREALDSLLAQTFTDFELIISDNGSTDGTEAICREYAACDARIRYVRQTGNCGVLFNFQFVLDAARGEYFMWMACDDIVSSNDYLAILVDAIKKGFDYVFPDVNVIEMKDGEPIVKASNIMGIFSECSDRYSYCMKSIQINSHQVYGLFKKTSLLEQVGYFYRCGKMRCFNEGIFVHAISANLSGCYVSNAIKIYRLHLRNASRVVPAHFLLIDFLEFTAMSIKFWINESHLTIFQRISILSNIVNRHGRYGIYLMVATCKQFLSLMWKRVF